MYRCFYLLVHEAAHVIAARLLNLKVNEIELLLAVPSRYRASLKASIQRSSWQQPGLYQCPAAAALLVEFRLAGCPWYAGFCKH